MKSTSSFIVTLNRVVRFAFAMVLLNLATAVLWESFVNGQLYHCSDHGGFDYLSPGDWVHDPVTVDHIEVGNHSMEDPDLIKSEWSERSLWLLWSAFLLGTFLLSSLFSKFGFDFFQSDTRHYSRKKN